MSLAGRASVRDLSGDATRARVDALEAMEIGEQAHVSNTIAFAGTTLGSAHVQDGSWAEAVEVLERARSLVQKDRLGILKTLNLCPLARAYLGRGDGRKARELADEAVRSGTWIALAQLTLARVLLGTEGSRAADAVEAALRRVDEIAERERARNLEAEMLEVRAELARLLGDLDEHERELREAHRLWTEMGATGHAERVARELEH
jgi:tetratricopeptide (TPR) repeat protein